MFSNSSPGGKFWWRVLLCSFINWTIEVWTSTRSLRYFNWADLDRWLVFWSSQGVMVYFRGVRTGGSPWSNYRKLSELIKTLHYRLETPHNTRTGHSSTRIIKSSQRERLDVGIVFSVYLLYCVREIQVNYQTKWTCFECCCCYYELELEI